MNDHQANAARSNLPMSALAWALACTIGSWACLAPDENFVEPTASSHDTFLTILTTGRSSDADPTTLASADGSADAGGTGSGPETGHATLTTTDSGATSGSGETLGGDATSQDATSTTSMTGPDSSTVGDEVGLDSESSEGVDSSSNDSGPGDVTSGSSTSDTGPSSTATSSDSSESTTQADATDTGAIPENRESIWVRNPSSFVEATPGFAVSLVFDHASLVASGASPDGNDLRVLHYDTDSKTYTQIDRVLESDSGWGRIDTKIWFRTQILITRLTVDGVAHWLQWGGDDLTPPRADPARVFDYFDDFDTARYSLSTQGTPDVMVAGGNLVVTANANSSTYQSATMRFFGVDFQYRGIIVESRTKVTNPQIKFLCGGAPVVQLEDTSASWIRAAMDVFDGRHHHTRWVTDRLQGTPGGATANAGWHIYGLNWINDDVVLTRDAIDLFSGKSPSEWATPDHGKLRPVLNLQGGGASCAGSGEVGLEMDWLRVRRTGTEHPVASFPDPY